MMNFLRASLLSLIALAPGIGAAPPTTMEPALVVIPPLPTAGDWVSLTIVDPQPADAGNFIYVNRRGEEPERWDGTWTPTSNPSTRAFGPRQLPAGTYDVGHYYVPMDYFPEEKAHFVFTVSPSGPVIVVEFHNAALDRYFITADTAEIARLDSGEPTGWARTGESFRALSPGTPASNARPVCRYWGVPEAGIHGHFFSASPEECAAVAAKWPEQWLLETSEAFLAIAPPYPYTCEADAGQRVYRLYDDRTGPRHRYTASRAVRDKMVADGWVEEGAPLDGPYEDIYAMCVPW